MWFLLQINRILAFVNHINFVLKQNTLENHFLEKMNYHFFWTLLWLSENTQIAFFAYLQQKLKKCTGEKLVHPKNTQIMLIHGLNKGPNNAGLAKTWGGG